ncbi:hypothetical protein CALCODRAFT_497540 [Calocera cornea HHB12733]|uniref:Uncharacterized protein n=1 Tax=Calocera cornea HHB12733 TaxID=1353952 RepID=A0A165F843_9BASI|nr:hypothetical protein CALCODRAFT_497540 [Calocera cornea HHB12733]
MPHNSFTQSSRYCNCLSARAVGSVLGLVNWKTVESRHRSGRANVCTALTESRSARTCAIQKLFRAL